MPLSYSVCVAQNTATDSLFNRFNGFYQAGDLFKAEEMMLTVLKQETNSYDPYTFAANNNLGVINQMLGKYEKALEYYNIAEQLVTGKEPIP